MSEALLPGTDAITKGEIEMGPHGGKYMVRYRQLDGTVRRDRFADPDEAHKYFMRCKDHLERCLAARAKAEER